MKIVELCRNSPPLLFGVWTPGAYVQAKYEKWMNECCICNRIRCDTNRLYGTKLGGISFSGCFIFCAAGERRVLQKRSIFIHNFSLFIYNWLQGAHETIFRGCSRKKWSRKIQFAFNSFTHGGFFFFGIFKFVRIRLQPLQLVLTAQSFNWFFEATMKEILRTRKRRKSTQPFIDICRRSISFNSWLVIKNELCLID